MFLVLTASRLPEHLHGYLTRFLTEVDTGVFVGNVSRRVRDNLWKRCSQALEGGRLTMINNDPTREQGFAVNTMGSGRHLIQDFDGLLLPVTLSDKMPENEDFAL